MRVELSNKRKLAAEKAESRKKQAGDQENEDIGEQNQATGAVPPAMEDEDEEVDEIPEDDDGVQ